MIKNEEHIPVWLTQLDAEDYAFLKRFILASGSLKAVAGQYGVSYPTVRARLDRLIAKVEALLRYADTDPFQQRLQSLVAEGRLDARTAENLLEAHRLTCTLEKGDRP